MTKERGERNKDKRERGRERCEQRKIKREMGEGDRQKANNVTDRQTWLRAYDTYHTKTIHHSEKVICGQGLIL
jgi:hypothetical protein